MVLLVKYSPCFQHSQAYYIGIFVKNVTSFIENWKKSIYQHSRIIICLKTLYKLLLLLPTTRHFFPLWNMEQFDIKNHLFLLCKVECSCVPEFLARQEPPPSRRQLFPVELVQLAACCAACWTGPPTFWPSCCWWNFLKS